VGKIRPTEISELRRNNATYRQLENQLHRFILGNEAPTDDTNIKQKDRKSVQRKQ